MRGTLVLYVLPVLRPGIIPAYAGNTCSRMFSATYSRDHPRVCGEHRQTIPQTPETSGSSPRMRGTLSVSQTKLFALGIIPAYAGNTLFLVHNPITGRDHPRVCGEHSPTCPKSGGALGSSPRMRGTPVPIFEHVICAGIIPAYAGNTTIRTALKFGDRDHPRVCGEHNQIAVSSQ